MVFKNDSLEFLAFVIHLLKNPFQYFLESKSGFKAYFSIPGYDSKIFFVFSLNFNFSLKRTEIFYFEYDSSMDMVSELNSIPNQIQEAIIGANTDNAKDKLNIESSFIRCYERLLQTVEKRKEELVKNTFYFQKEEFKNRSNQSKSDSSVTREIKSSEAQEKWDPCPERKSRWLIRQKMKS